MTLDPSTLTLSGYAPTLLVSVPSLVHGPDLTTAFSLWLAGQAFEGDVTTRLRDTLAMQFAFGDNADLTTLMARFDDLNLEPDPPPVFIAARLRAEPSGVVARAWSQVRSWFGQEAA